MVPQFLKSCTLYSIMVTLPPTIPHHYKMRQLRKIARQAFLYLLVFARAKTGPNLPNHHHHQCHIYYTTSTTLALALGAYYTSTNQQTTSAQNKSIPKHKIPASTAYC